MSRAGEPFAAFIERVVAPGMVVITCGLPATNKTESMEVLAAGRDFTVLRTDALRGRVLAGEDIFDNAVASDMNKRERVYDVMFAMADDLAARGRGVILDATFLTQALRRRAAEVAARHGRTLLIHQTRAPESYSLAKIAGRTRENYESNALTEQAYRNNQERFEPVDLDNLTRGFPGLQIIHTLVDTGSDDPGDWLVLAEHRR